jgi:RHS repeat-associated protein
LYYYGARWSPGRLPGTGDPSAGRFLQADTIVPGAGNSQAYDRYAYTLNNPLRYTDPSGHDYCDSPYADPQECEVIDKNGDGKTDYKVTLSDDLNFCNDNACYDGAMMNELYWKYVHTSGWWNDYGERFFTIRDFLSLILYYEMMGVADNDPIAANAYTQAINQKMIYLCAQFSSTGSCADISDNAILNYIATRGSAWMRYDSYITFGMTIPSYDNYNLDHNTANIVATNSLIIHPNGGQGGLWDFGNLTMFPEGNRDAIKIVALGYAYNQVVWRSADRVAYVLTADQIEYWYTPP